MQHVPLLLRRVGPHRVDTAALVGAARGGAALLIGGKLAIAGVARLAALQAIIVLHLGSGHGGSGCRDGQGGNRRKDGDGKMTMHEGTPV